MSQQAVRLILEAPKDKPGHSRVKGSPAKKHLLGFVNPSVYRPAPYWLRWKRSPIDWLRSRLLGLNRRRPQLVSEPEHVGQPLGLTRPACNPILTPIPEHNWESRQTFNPAALLAEERVHLLYRAIGEDGVSRLGYACTINGTTIEERLSRPVYTCLQVKAERVESLPYGGFSYSSGGSWAGCEDPRLTRVGDTVHMFFVAFDGYNIPRLATTSIDYEDFARKRWGWRPARIISKPGVIDKSGCVLPEKVRGQYVVFHRVFPNILIDFLDSLDFQDSQYLEGRYSINVRRGCWDSRKIGIGAPPIKTKHGWLVIYYGVDDLDANRYKMGAMLLDLKNPTQVLYRSRRPILEPVAHYENNGHKAGVAYPCGAAMLDGRLFVYYGGADSVVCAAMTETDRLLAALLKEPA